eukprot:CAMPEP_0201890750 /NCGR_PEP_ID=MMETSP0902-20130614/32905_1 /ASSEMBLY_ACC=CAM_ASM_000551 /TAXON_ID=420261 /ORGANISM="Thalassiosira antarctica, Strain CCMP982" /LENGTH=136 /DNA_ID=CAMNT_0048421701 /DNA_START=661 /DNA_END=1067 /DNA_ORIENTATION=-
MLRCTLVYLEEVLHEVSNNPQRIIGSTKDASGALVRDGVFPSQILHILPTLLMRLEHAIVPIIFGLDLTRKVEVNSPGYGDSKTVVEPLIGWVGTARARVILSLGRSKASEARVHRCGRRKGYGVALSSHSLCDAA